jgi:hypothetical protein
MAHVGHIKAALEKRFDGQINLTELDGLIRDLCPSDRTHGRAGNVRRSASANRRFPARAKRSDGID